MKSGGFWMLVFVICVVGGVIGAMIVDAVEDVSHHAAAENQAPPANIMLSEPAP